MPKFDHLDRFVDTQSAIQVSRGDESRRGWPAYRDDCAGWSELPVVRCHSPEPPQSNNRRVHPRQTRTPLKMPGKPEATKICWCIPLNDRHRPSQLSRPSQTDRHGVGRRYAELPFRPTAPRPTGASVNPAAPDSTGLGKPGSCPLPCNVTVMSREPCSCAM